MSEGSQGSVNLISFHKDDIKEQNFSHLNVQDIFQNLQKKIGSTPPKERFVRMDSQIQQTHVPLCSSSLRFAAWPVMICDGHRRDSPEIGNVHFKVKRHICM